MDSLRKNKTWELVDHPAGQKLVSCKWLFKIKEGIEGVQRPRYKARLVAHGFTQRADYELEQLDVKTAFLTWESLVTLGNVYKRVDEYKREQMWFILEAEIGSTKSLFKKKFDMKELEKAKKILDNGKSVQMPLGGHFKLSLKDCDCDVERMSKVPYANAVGSLMYLMVCTRPDIAYAYRTYSGNHVDVTGFVDSDYAKDPDKGRSSTSYAFLVQMCFVKQKNNAQTRWSLFTTEARSICPYGVCEGESLWLGDLEELGKTVEVLKVGTEHNVADALTKMLPGLKLQHFFELLSAGIG
ncbi:retrotransposon protein, putative, ty1-copia subclass [Tanacetum coccineum]